jgi:hypothetical protein
MNAERESFGPVSDDDNADLPIVIEAMIECMKIELLLLSYLFLLCNNKNNVEIV